MAEDVVAFDRRSLDQRFPVLRIFGAIRQAFDYRKVLIATVGLIILHAGFAVLHRALPSATGTAPDLISPIAQNRDFRGDYPRFWPTSSFAELYARIAEPFRLVASDVLTMFRPGADWRTMVRALLSLVWVAIIWGIAGGAIARITIVQIAALARFPYEMRSDSQCLMRRH